MRNSALSYNAPGTVSGVFFTKKDADKAYDALIRRGHTHEDISVLMSDETLGKHENPSAEPIDPEGTASDSPIDKATNAISGAIISITSMISLPGLGIAISNTLLKRISRKTKIQDNISANTAGASIADERTDPFGNSMKEGGIIISVDPRNSEEKRAIVKDFKENNGHDILGDDGYTELG